MPSLTSKKWGNKDLQVKPGESLEVIQNIDDAKVLCRNEEGKCKSLLTLRRYGPPEFNNQISIRDHLLTLLVLCFVNSEKHYETRDLAVLKSMHFIFISFHFLPAVFGTEESR